MLRTKHTSSCGCLQAELASKRRRNSEASDSTITQIFNSYRGGASSRGYSFDLSREEVKELVLSPCYYCSRKPFALANYWLNSPGLLKKPRTYLPHDTQWVEGATIAKNGIDRLDNELGYSRSNCVPACEPCNRAKGVMTADAFINLCHLVASNHPLVPASDDAVISTCSVTNTGGT
jgi:hypothetical protein